MLRFVSCRSAGSTREAALAVLLLGDMLRGVWVKLATVERLQSRGRGAGLVDVPQYARLTLACAEPLKLSFSSVVCSVRPIIGGLLTTKESSVVAVSRGECLQTCCFIAPLLPRGYYYCTVRRSPRRYSSIISLLVLNFVFCGPSDEMTFITIFWVTYSSSPSSIVIYSAAAESCFGGTYTLCCGTSHQLLHLPSLYPIEIVFLQCGNRVAVPDNNNPNSSLCALSCSACAC